MAIIYYEYKESGTFTTYLALHTHMDTPDRRKFLEKNMCKANNHRTLFCDFKS